LSWFLIPGVELAKQQHQVLMSALPPVGIALLMGSSGVDKWSNKEIWDELLQAPVVISTHQVLLDALTHGFVQMERIGLLIFDEAHHCIQNHPANMIMRHFYHERVRDGLPVPDILGLTASPIMKSNPAQLKIIESNLNAIARTPLKHRKELLENVRPPKLKLVSSFYAGVPNSLASLLEAYECMDIMEDPYIIMLQRRLDNRAERDLQMAIMSEKTYSQEHMKTFVNKACHIMSECGVWATDWFITGVMDEALGDDDADKDDRVGDDFRAFFSTGDEARYVRRILQEVVLPSTLGPIEDHVSAKVDTLIEVLLEEYSAEHSDFSGLVFVTQRAAVAVIAQIISQHPKTRDLFRVGTMVGTSTSAQRNQRFLHDVLVGGKKQEGTLRDFRAGKLNLLIATSAIEEGIDIQDCHLVVCFDLPTNLKSFVQRRGRARRESSSYVIMLGSRDTSGVIAFQEMEKEMIKMYSDPNRELEQVEDDECEEGEDRVMRMNKTQALLMFANVLPHLYHFCDCLPMGDFVDSRPEFRTECKILPPPGGGREWTAEVILPNAIDQAIRRSSGTRAWKTERAAKRDAAFEAFLKLIKLQLVDDYLMPLVKGEFQNEQEVQKRAPRVEVDQRMDIWAEVGKKWENAESLYIMTLTLDFDTGRTVSVDMVLPVEVPYVEEFELFWPLSDTANARFGRSRRIDYDPMMVERGRKATRRLMMTVFNSRMDAMRDDFIYLFLPSDGGESWDMIPDVHQNALELINERNGDLSNIGLLRKTSNQMAYIFRRLVTDVDIGNADDFKAKSPRNRDKVRADQPLIEVNELPKRRDFLHREGFHKPCKTLLLLPEFLTVEPLPLKYAMLALFLPALINRVEKALLAADLKKTLQLDVPNQLLVHATTASATRDPVDYQRLEFLGDSVLKVLASVALMDEFPLWPEGYLTAAKDHVVSNGTSSKSAAEKRLSRWINLAPFTALKWKPRYADSNVTPPDSKMLSTKILADVVESIIGVSYLTGGYDLATQCCATFNLGVDWPWHPLTTRASRLRANALSNASKQGARTYPQHFTELQQLLGYSFDNPLLLIEATTHLSYGAGGAGDATNTTSYQRLEFLGDAVIDTVVVNTLYHFHGLSTPLTHINMHHLKSCCVNAHFLAFLCLGATTTIERTETNAHSAPTRRKVELPLHRFLRHNNPELRHAQDACARRYRKWKDTIAQQLESSPEYPWTDLQELDAPKHLSDIIESIVGAIWVDSNGSFAAVEAFLERIGVMKVLRRLVRDRVTVNHPLSRFGIMVAEGGRMGVVKYHCEQEDGGLYSCELTVDAAVWTKVERCASRQHARTKAARAGIEMFGEKEKERIAKKKAEEEEERRRKLEEEEQEKRKQEEEEVKMKQKEEVEVDEELHEDDNDDEEGEEEEFTDAPEDGLDSPAEFEVHETRSRMVLRSADVLLKNRKGRKGGLKVYESSSEDTDFFDAKDYQSSAVSEVGGGD
ncbi:hypothetical protein BZA05DRAFT_331211, partial [Tricharina praecox]|uniref:uncharacterized protein n=1 Tax=Tricharina praecox TaxID=43433 RepID=UPI0022208510